MKLNIPWIVSRRSVLFAAILDFICTFLYNFVYQSEFNNDPNNIVTNTFSNFSDNNELCIGRYEKTKNIFCKYQ